MRPQKPLRLTRDGNVGGSGFLYLTPTRYTVTTRMILVWAKSQDSVHESKCLKRRERRAEADRLSFPHSLTTFKYSVIHSVTHLTRSPRGLTFTWWGCCGLCLWHKLTQLAHSFLICFCVCFCLCSPFNCISFHIFPENSPLSQSVLLVLFLPYSSFQLYISLWKSPSALI